MENRAFTFNDIVLVPYYSDLERGDVSLISNFFHYDLQVPILSSPMDTITEIPMMDAMYKHGGLGVHHRGVNYKLVTASGMHDGAVAVCPSLGLNFIQDELLGQDPNLILVMDVAHGYTKRNLEFCKALVDMGANVVSGNIVTVDAMKAYADIGVKYFRVGIGSGSACLTRVVTGVGYPQASAIKELADAKEDDWKIISDGGHRTTGDIVKALVLGADFVMLGGMLAGTDEAAGKNTFRGMASAEALSERKKEFFIEGVSMDVPSKGSVADVMDNIRNAIETACYYLGARDLSELREVDYELVTENSYIEGLPHSWRR